MLKKIYRIQDFYDLNISKLTDERDQNGRKIHKRKTMAELERDYACPYESCGKTYASEGSLNLHIKRKHNGGNKTDREKIAKSLLYYKAKGYRVAEQLDLNLPPGIIKKVAEQVESTNNLTVTEDVIKTLEDRIHVQNRLDQQRQREQQLQKAEEESKRAQLMVAARQCTPPRKSKILERHLSRKNEAAARTKQPLLN